MAAKRNTTIDFSSFEPNLAAKANEIIGFFKVLGQIWQQKKKKQLVFSCFEPNLAAKRKDALILWNETDNVFMFF